MILLYDFEFESLKYMSIKEKLEKYEFFLENAPCILDMNNRRVLVNKEAPNPNELASFEDYNSYWEGSRNLTQKLKVESYGDWELSVAVVNTKHFDCFSLNSESRPKSSDSEEFLSKMRYRCVELKSAVKWTFICSIQTKSKRI